jgi:tetratricopeptide (TPR) repeat protein
MMGAGMRLVLAFGCVLGAVRGAEAAAPPTPPGKLRPADVRRLRALDAAVEKRVAAGDFAEAVKLAQQALALRTRRQGRRHWEVIDARLEVESWKLLGALSEDQRKELTATDRVIARAAKLRARGRYAAAARAWREVLTVRRKLLGEAHVLTAGAHNEVAANLEDAGQARVAQAFYGRALAIQRKVLGERHPGTATGYNNLAICLHSQGKYRQAQPPAEKALLVRRELLGEANALTAQSYDTLAGVLGSQGKHAQAQPLYEKGLAIKRKVLGERDPSTAISYSNVAFNLNAQGKHRQAQPLYEKALAICRKALGERHPYTAQAYNNLGHNLNAQAKYKAAQQAYDKALAIYKQVLGEQHPSTASCYTNLAANLAAQGEHDLAQPSYEKALAVYRKALGEDHPNTALGYYNLAGTLAVQGKYAQAQPLYEKALAIYRKVLGDAHRSTALGYVGVAGNLNAQGMHARAQPLYEKALAITRAVLGEKHADTAAAYNNVAFNLDDQGRHAQAQSLYQKALDIDRQVLGELHPSTAASYNNLAYNLDIQGKHALAGRLYARALAIHRKVLGEQHPMIAVGYNNAAMNLHAQGKYDKAQPLFEKALAIQGKARGESHPSTASSCDNLASNLDLLGKHDRAQRLYERALAIRRKVLGEQHPNTALTYNKLGHNLHAQGKHKEAVARLESALVGYDSGWLDSNATGFQRALFNALRDSPRPLLAACLARLGRPLEAWQHAEADLARGLLDDLAARSEKPDQSAATLNARLNWLDSLLVPLLAADKLSAEQRKRRDGLVRQRRSLLAARGKRAAERSARHVWSLERIQNRLPADSAVVLWLDVESEHWGCVLRAKGPPRWERLPGSGPKGAWTKQDDELPDRLYGALTRRINFSEAKRGELVKALLAQRLTPLRRHLRKGDGLPAVRRLLVVPAGEMAVVPLEVLTRDYRISYIPSASVFARLAAQHRRLEGTSLVALGDPVFDVPARREPEPPKRGVLLKLVLPGGNAARAGLQAGDVLLRYGTTPVRRPADLGGFGEKGPVRVRYWRQGKEAVARLRPGRLGVVVDARPAPVAVRAWREVSRSPVRRGSGHKRLPGTRFEVEALARLVGKDRTTLLLGSSASEQELDRLVKEKRLGKARLLHLATHGEIDVRRPERSALVLAQDRLPPAPAAEVLRGGKAYDGRLRVGTILERWQLDADLVVLSACQTALGKAAGGEGLLGFAQAFLQKGARSVVLSRWKVDDTATALLMLRFYENLLGKREGLKKALPRAEALGEAQQWLRTLRRKQAEGLAARLARGVLRGTIDKPLPEVKGKPEVLPAGDRPFAHPNCWAAFVLVGDPD